MKRKIGLSNEKVGKERKEREKTLFFSFCTNSFCTNSFYTNSFLFLLNLMIYNPYNPYNPYPNLSTSLPCHTLPTVCLSALTIFLTALPIPPPPPSLSTLTSSALYSLRGRYRVAVLGAQRSFVGRVVECDDSHDGEIPNYQRL